MFGHDLPFWLAVIGATLVKLFTSPFTSFWRALATVFAAVFSAYIFTDPAVAWLDLDPFTYTAPMAALLALTGEGLMRLIMASANDPAKLFELFRQWRSGK